MGMYRFADSYATNYDVLFDVTTSNERIGVYGNLESQENG